MATCAQESHLGTYRHQINGPALGIFQMEPATFHDIWQNYLAFHVVLAARLRALHADDLSQLQDNDSVAIAMARVHYLRAPGALPAATDLDGLWSYYKRYYNTEQGAATRAQFCANYAFLVRGIAK